MDFKEELGIIAGVVITVSGMYFNNSTAVLGGIVITGGSAGINVFRKLKNGGM